MMVKVEDCLVCGATKAILFERTREQGMTLTNWLCSDCGLVWLSPRMTAQEAEQFYKSGYHELYSKSTLPTRSVLEQQRSRAEAVVGFVEKNIGSVNIETHLDIGSGSGALLRASSLNFGCDSVGIEMSDAYRDYSQQHGFKVYASLEAYLMQSTAVDLITLSHVMEHLVDPIAFLRVLRDRVLSKRGLIVIEVPNLFGHSCFEIGHLYSFSSDSLQCLLEKIGFRVRVTEIHGRPKSESAPLFISVVAERQVSKGATLKNTKHKENVFRVRARRRLGIIRALPPSQKVRGLLSTVKHMFTPLN